MPQAYRYAVYLAPVGAWRELGSAWLGRDEDTGRRVPRSHADDPRLDAWTDAPRHYGLHATLKPPFRLRHGTTAAALDEAVRALARMQAPFHITLTLRALRGFLAWCLPDDAGMHARVRALADRMVRDLDAYRAPPTPAEIARRRPDQLTLPQQRMLAEWGYPYVFDTFTFHITLTGQLGPTELEHAEELLRARAGRALDGAMPVEAVSVYVQPGPDDPFLAARHYRFDGSVRDAAGACYMDDDPSAPARPPEGRAASHGEDVAQRQEGTPSFAPARPPEGRAPSHGEDVAQRQEGTPSFAPARPPEGRAPSHGEESRSDRRVQR